MKLRTPKNLCEAVINGMVDSRELNIFSTVIVTKIEDHVKDYINQKLAVLMLSDDESEIKVAEKLRDLLLQEAA